MKILLYFLVLSIFGGCSHQVVKIATDGPAEVALLSWNDLNAEGEVVGQSPLELKVESIGDRVIRIGAPGKSPQYWVLTEMLGDTLDLKVKLANLPKDATVKAQVYDLNQSHRILMRAYQALAARDLELAKQLADQLNKLLPDLAAPHIVSGLADLELGKRESARQSFGIAKSLDPLDKDIDALIKATQ